METQHFTVLIADDNELNRWVLREQLAHWTQNITEAKDGRDAWQLLQNHCYRLIFLDMNMPYFNGLTLIEKIRLEENPNRSTSVIAVTAHSDNQLSQKVLAAGFNAYLVKPVSLKHLRPIVESGFSTTEAPAYYAKQAIEKIAFNHDVCRQLLEKLFTEVPQQLNDIEQSLQQADFEIALLTAHKLHGTFSFYGFADFLPNAAGLERELLSRNAAAANAQLQTLCRRFSSLDKTAILAEIPLLTL